MFDLLKILKYLLGCWLLLLGYVQPATAQQFLSEASTYHKPEPIPVESKKVAEAEARQSVELQVYPNIYSKNSTLLLHLPDPVMSVQVLVIDRLGNVVNLPFTHQPTSGFYEIPLSDQHFVQGLYVVRLIVDGKIYSRCILR